MDTDGGSVNGGSVKEWYRERIERGRVRLHNAPTLLCIDEGSAMADTNCFKSDASSGRCVKTCKTELM